MRAGFFVWLVILSLGIAAGCAGSDMAPTLDGSKGELGPIHFQEAGPLSETGVKLDSTIGWDSGWDTIAGDKGTQPLDGGPPPPDSTIKQDTSGCVPQCTGKQCGPNGCGGSCGTCPAPKLTCANGQVTRTESYCVQATGTCKSVAASGPCAYGCAVDECASPPVGTGGTMNIVWRWWRPGSADHMSTVNASEKPGSSTFEGQTFYVPAATGTGKKTLYRLYSGPADDHMVSNSSTEGSSAGYTSEGPLGYPFTTKHVGTEQLRRWYSGSSGDHLLAFSGESPGGYTGEGIMGYGHPRYGKQLTSLATVTGAGGVTIKANRVAGGAIWELSWNGKQFINDYDFGRQIQIAFNLTNQAEVNNPTEAGSKYTHSASMGGAGYLQGSPLVLAQASGSTLTTAARPLQWNPDLHGGGKHHPHVWDGFIGKKLTVGFNGMSHVIRWTTVVHFPKKVSYLDAEVVTAYLNGEFTRFWAYDATTKALKEMTAQVPGGACLDPSQAPAQLQPKAGGVLISTSSQGHALGVYRHRGQRNFGLCKFLGGSSGQYGSSTTKWNALERHGSGVNAGTQVWTAYLVVGTVADCTTAMDALYSAGY